MAEAKEEQAQESIAALDPEDRPPLNRYCDVVLEGGVVNGVVYPGFLMEIARKFHFHAIAGASVGAIAAALAAACEYNRRFGSDNGFNEGLAKMPDELADWVEKGAITKIQSLFQPESQVKPLFDWAVDAIGSRVNPANEKRRQSSKAEETIEQEDAAISVSNLGQIPLWKTVFDSYRMFFKHFSPVACAAHIAPLRRRTALALLVPSVFLGVSWLLAYSYLIPALQILLIGLLFLVYFCVGPLLFFALQVRRVVLMPGFGMCTGMRAAGDKNASLVEWLHEGIQKSAQIPLHQPLTFGELWRAPGGPSEETGKNSDKSIDLRMITTCLSQGRIYELPQKNGDTPILFRLSELKQFFPESVINHLRMHSNPVDVMNDAFFIRRFKERKDARSNDTVEIDNKIKACQAMLQANFNELEQADSVDIRILPIADLPIVVAARMSMSCPVLFQAVPFLGLNLDCHAEDMEIVRLWFSDGGIGSNFPIHIFDQAIPKWPTLGLKLLDVSPRKNSKGKVLLTYLPFFHYLGADDNLIFPNDKEAFSNSKKRRTVGTFIQFLFSIYTSAKDGNDQSYLRTPDIRNRVVRVYMNNRSGNALNLKIEPDVIRWLAGAVGVQGGRNAADAYLADLENDKYRDKVNLWQDHRWVRMRMLIDGLRQYLKGAGQAIDSNQLPGVQGPPTLRDQIFDATPGPHVDETARPQLGSFAGTESYLTSEQAAQLNTALDAIIALEHQLTDLDLPQAYKPEPQPVLRFKPQY
jgi:predicted acylesterase/phospholipase RssA